MTPQEIFVTKVKLYFLRCLYKTFKELSKEAGFAYNHFTKLATNTYRISRAAHDAVGLLFDKYATDLDKRRVECIISDDSGSASAYYLLPLNDRKFDSLLRYYVTIPTHSIDNLDRTNTKLYPRLPAFKPKPYNPNGTSSIPRPPETLGVEMVEKLRAFIRQHNANKTDI